MPLLRRLSRPLPLILALLLLEAWGGGGSDGMASPAEELLVPQRVDLLARLASAEGHLREAAALGAALGRIHNHMAQGNLLRCEAPEAASLAWRASLLGQAWRDGLQSARAEAARTRRMRAAPTVAPLLSLAEQARLDDLEATLSAATHAWQAAAGWQQVYVAPWSARCPWSPAARPGLPSATPATDAEHRAPIAVLAVGAAGGVVCPQQVPVRPAGVAVVVEEGRACLAASAACDCAPQELLPGAVLATSGGGP